MSHVTKNPWNILGNVVAYLYAKNSGEPNKNPDDFDVARNWTAFVDKLRSFQTEQKSFNEDVLTLVKIAL